MMKILYINYTKKNSGGFIHTLEFVKSVIDLGHNIIVYPTLKDKYRDNISDSKKDKKINNVISRSFFIDKFFSFIHKYFYDLFFVKSVIFKGLFLNYFNELRIIKKVNPEVVILRVDTSYISIVICKMLKIPLVLEVNAPIAEKNIIGYLRFEKFWSWLLEAKLFKLADNILVVSEPLRQCYIEMGLNPANIFTIPNGVDTNRFFPDNPLRSELIKQFGLEDFKIIGFTGNFRIWHGLESFFDIYQEIAAKMKYVKLLVVGDGPEKEYFMSKVRNLGLSEQVLFTCRINHEDMPAVLSVFDIAIAPYEQNDFFYFSPLKIFEYMASGCAVIAPGLGQINDLIEDGVSGVLYNACKPDELISAIYRLLEDDKERKKLGIAARQRIYPNFTWTNNAQKILQVCGASVKKER